MMPPTPLQNSNDTFEEEQEHAVVEDVECERKNDHFKNETIFGKKLQRERGS